MYNYGLKDTYKEAEDQYPSRIDLFISTFCALSLVLTAGLMLSGEELTAA